MSRISVRGFAVASATAVTTVGAVVGVASGAQPGSVANTEATAADATIADIPAGQQAQVETASLVQQADDQSTQADAAALKTAQEAARKAAAESAQAKKDAAEKQVAAEKQAAKERAEAKKQAASRSAERGPLGDIAVKASYSIAETQAMARQMMPADQFQCFSNIVDHESGWNYRATNAGSGAYGLVQALPGSKMASAGSDWQTNPATQIKWGLGYMNDRYGSPCGAWSFWQANSWY
ncbi:lytic transglycosylase domain-containing protein [Streptomyces sp. NPDC000151]|uniref:aggregation-promoting factor C-terminal-like domain-containing protein n=1 Tax=Streptomyces sp. NPDC000151 TaxID=3154244 RepID=UPI0033308726